MVEAKLKMAIKSYTKADPTTAAAPSALDVIMVLAAMAAYLDEFQ